MLSLALKGFYDGSHYITITFCVLFCIVSAADSLLHAAAVPFPTHQAHLLPPTIHHLWFTDVTTPDLNPDPAEHLNLGHTLAKRLPRLLTLVLRCAGPGGAPSVDTEALAAIAAGETARLCKFGCQLGLPYRLIVCAGAGVAPSVNTEALAAIAAGETAGL
jgi:hypothetical protein